jgi:hypothetical protein
MDLYRYIRNSEYLVDLCSGLGKVHRVFIKEESRWHSTTDAVLLWRKDEPLQLSWAKQAGSLVSSTYPYLKAMQQN